MAASDGVEGDSGASGIDCDWQRLNISVNGSTKRSSFGAQQGRDNLQVAHQTAKCGHFTPLSL